MKQRNILIKQIKLDHNNNRQANTKQQEQLHDQDEGDNLDDFLNKPAGTVGGLNLHLTNDENFDDDADDCSSSVSSVDSDFGNFNIWDNSELQLRGINPEDFTDFYGKKLSFLQLFKLRSSFFAKGKRPTFKEIFKGAERVFRFCRSELSLQEFLSDENIEHSVVSLDMNSDRNVARFTHYFQDCIEMNSQKMRQTRYDRYHNDVKCDSGVNNNTSMNSPEFPAASNRHPSNFTRAAASGVLNGLNLSPRKAPKKIDSVRKSQMNLHQLSQMQKKQKIEITKQQTTRQSQDEGERQGEEQGSNSNNDRINKYQEPEDFSTLMGQVESSTGKTNNCASSNSHLGSLDNLGGGQHSQNNPGSQQSNEDVEVDDLHLDEQSPQMTQSQGLLQQKQQQQSFQKTGPSKPELEQLNSFKLKLQSAEQDKDQQENYENNNNSNTNRASSPFCRPKIPSGADWSPRKRLAFEQQQRELQQKQQQQTYLQNGNGSPSLFSQFIDKTALQQQPNMFNHGILATAEFNSSARTLFGMAKLKQQQQLASPVKASTLNNLPELQHFQSTQPVQQPKRTEIQQLPSLKKEQSEKQRHASTDFNRTNGASMHQQVNQNANHLNEQLNARLNTQQQQQQVHPGIFQAPSSILFLSKQQSQKELIAQQQQQVQVNQRLQGSPVLKGQHRKYFSQHITSNDVKKINQNGIINRI